MAPHNPNLAPARRDREQKVTFRRSEGGDDEREIEGEGRRIRKIRGRRQNMAVKRIYYNYTSITIIVPCNQKWKIKHFLSCRLSETSVSCIFTRPLLESDHLTGSGSHSGTSSRHRLRSPHHPPPHDVPFPSQPWGCPHPLRSLPPCPPDYSR